MADRYPDLIPMIAYEDPAAAIEWLARAFGFKERGKRSQAPDGRITHAEMELGGAVIMLANPTPDYEGPRHHREACEAARRWSQVPWVVDGLLVHVDDVPAHHRRALEAGAKVLSGPDSDFPRYRVEDLEGHRWMFSERA